MSHAYLQYAYNICAKFQTDCLKTLGEADYTTDCLKTLGGANYTNLLPNVEG